MVKLCVTETFIWNLEQNNCSYLIRLAAILAVDSTPIALAFENEVDRVNIL